MKITDWVTFRRTFVTRPAQGRVVPKPRPRQLDAFETEAGFKLPASYREFIRTFGPGAFPNELQIAAPGYPDLHPSLSLERSDNYYRVSPQDLPQDRMAPDDLAVIRRLYMFGEWRDRIWLGWDRGDVLDPVDHEYAIVSVDSFHEVKLMATSFRQLIENVATMMLAPDPLWSEKEMGPQRCFQPATQPDSGNASR